MVLEMVEVVVGVVVAIVVTVFHSAFVGVFIVGDVGMVESSAGDACFSLSARFFFLLLQNHSCMGNVVG